MLDLALQVLLELGATADKTNPQPLLVQFVGETLQRLHDQFHQVSHFVLGPSPVFTAEREQGQKLDALAGKELDATTRRFDPLTMAEIARHHALFRPTPITIHDDANVPGIRCLGVRCHEAGFSR